MAIVVNRSVTSADDQTQRMLNLFYPVGSYYETSDTSFNPNTAWGGTWVEDSKGRVLVGQDTTGTFATIDATGGSETVTLTVDQIPSHSHVLPYRVGTVSNGGSWFTDPGVTDGYSGATQATGGGQAHNNLQPYKVVKIWHRTA